ncbi:MAG TPA: FAD-linked oxidase C-terminal domain-containing protein [Gemmatimonadales bacterium]|nr:FAD-linked oxidase C-terminal domain-containing protein [Gemmatimonadales bacterium]
MISASPPKPLTDPDWAELHRAVRGNLSRDLVTRQSHATDASEYQELPAAVVTPEWDLDVGVVLAFARRHGLGVIARGAGTSLAGQVVGGGIVLDFTRHMHRIIAIDPVARTVRVQPGVVRDDLNRALAPHGLFFAPETSTANRATIGGMVGNNSCGANSIVYGATREHLIRVDAYLSDGSVAVFGPLDALGVAAKRDGRASVETRLYREVCDLLGSPEHRELIRAHYPKSTVTRRNTGYALDQLMDAAVFEGKSSKPFNLCRLIAGSEGTLCIGVEFTLALEPIPPPGTLLCAHFTTVADALTATLVAMRHRPSGCELIDRTILECTRGNLAQARNRFFVEGDPGAILVVEVREADPARAVARLETIARDMAAAGVGTHFPIVEGPDVGRVWELRRAGQGLLANVPGDAKPREIVEDTAVAVADLPAYIAEFDELMQGRYGISCVYYAHAGAGELHTRPLFNLRTPEGLTRFRAIAEDVAALVKRYRGSLSGEHGDGRLRGEFIPFMVGPECFAMMRRIKAAFDPDNLLNPGKIIDTPPMDTSLRVAPGDPDPRYLTVFDFGADGGLLRAAERCNGVGECRKSAAAGGTMCPSYMATRDEHDTTRARANVLRQALARPSRPDDPWTSDEVAAVMDLCLSCKGCRSECPSNVDMARLKAEWQQQRHDRLGVPWRAKQFARAGASLRRATHWPRMANALMRGRVSGRILRDVLGIDPRRSLPPVHGTTLRRWHAVHANPSGQAFPSGTVHLFADEFTDTIDMPVGAMAIQLLNALGYRVLIPEHVDSGRAHLSKGLVRDAQALARENVRRLAPVVTEATPLIGLEPSAILGFRDEYPDLVGPAERPAALELAHHALLFEEFVVREIDAGRITDAAFDRTARTVMLHGHCHQKALASTEATIRMLSLPGGHIVQEIPSGCCGMAGSFGYEREHYDLSMQIGELVLFPAVRGASEGTIIVAPGTSCRHQILDGTGWRTRHPVEVMWEALARSEKRGA